MRNFLVDEVIELDKKNREIKQEVEALRAEKKKSQTDRCNDGSGKREEAEAVKKRLQHPSVSMNFLKEKKK